MLAAWSTVYPDADLDPIIKPEARESFNQIIEPCFTSAAGFLLVRGEIQTPNEYVRVDLLTTEPWKSLLEANSVYGAIDVLLLITYGTAVQLACYPGSVHDAREDTALYALGWMVDRFAARPMPIDLGPCPSTWGASGP